MKKTINAVRGMPDILPQEIGYWQVIERHLRKLTNSYGYNELRLPIIESTELFKRSVGDITDIVEKEMYTFQDRNGDSLTLRPEGTAGVVRAGIEHSLFYGDTPKVWYLGQMFRHERPQKGRYRQFYQFGMEAFGCKSAYIDAEILAFCHNLWQKLGLQNKLKLQINCLGTKQVREIFRLDLVNYFKNNITQLDADSVRRLDKNPLRILDSKNPDLKNLISNAPKLTDYLDDASQKHMRDLYVCLDNLNIKYEINPYLVRGLDYYGLTVFEWVTDDLGAQGTVCAGGRYDSLVAEIGGQDTPAVGMSLGMERLVLLLQQFKPESSLTNETEIFLVLSGEESISRGLLLAEQLRECALYRIYVNTTNQSFKTQLKKADKSGARLAIIIGEDELKQNKFTAKLLRNNNSEQKLLTLSDLKELIRLELGGGHCERILDGRRADSSVAELVQEKQPRSSN